MSKIRFLVEGKKIIEVMVSGIVIPANANIENLSEIEKLLNKLMDLGLFKSSSFKEMVSYEELIDEFIDRLTDREKRLLKFLSTKEWTEKTELDKIIETKERETAGVLANLTRKARDIGLIDRDEQLIEKKLEGGKIKYKLRSKFSNLKKFIEKIE